MEELWNLILYNFMGCLLVFARVAGIFTFNPILGRQNVPMRVRSAMAITLAVCTLAGMGSTTGYIPQNIPSFVFVLLLEALLGLVFGFFVNMIMSALLLAGHVTDSKIGFMMANIMDPGTGIQMPVFAAVYNYIFILYFFLTNSHLSYIRLFVTSYDIIPIGFDFTLNTLALTRNIVFFFSTIMVLAMKLALPVVSSGMIVEVCVGVIMKAVPTIQIFVVNIQLKIIFGLIVILSLAKPISDFIDRLIGTMWENLDSILYGFI